MVPIYEYYDDYDHLWEDNTNRPRVKYVTLGTLAEPPHEVVIMYIGTDGRGCISYIGQKTHQKAWKAGEIETSEIVKMLPSSSSYRANMGQIQKEIFELEKNKEKNDQSNALLPGQSISGNISYFHINYHMFYGQSYTEQKIKALQKALCIYQMRDTFVALHKTN